MAGTVIPHLPMKAPLPWIIVGGIVVLGVGLAMAGIGGDGPVDNQDALEMAFAEVGEERGFVYSPNNYLQMGNSRAGVYVTDVNNDGYPDILATGGDEPILFENTGGAFEPADIIPEFNGTVNAALFFDQDGDGWEDLMLFTRNSPPILLSNEEGTYRRQEIGLPELRLAIPTAASAADYNDDGCLDVFIAQNGDWRSTIPQKELLGQSEAGLVPVSDLETARDLRERSDDEISSETPPPSEWAPQEDNGNPNYLLEGDCTNGTFVDVTDEVGIDGNRWSMATSFVDFTGNGYPDIHEANDFNYDYLWVNQNGTGFEPRLIPDSNRHAMSSQVADFNGDGQMDIFVTNIHAQGEAAGKKGFEMLDNSGNNLLINDNGTFTSQEDAYNVRDGGWGWAAASIDFTNDGDFDLFHTTLHGGDAHRVELTYPRVWERDGESFVEVNASTSGFVPMSGRGVAVLDFDRNGKEDLVISAMEDRFWLFENRGETAGWLQFTVRDDAGAIALGSDVTVRFDDERGERVHHLVTKSRTDLLAQHSRVHHVGLGSADTATVEVTFPDGTTHVYDSIDANQRVVLFANGTVETDQPDSSPGS